MAAKIIIALRRHYHCEHARAVLQQNNLNYPVYELDEDNPCSPRLQSVIKEGAQILITGDVYAGIIMEKLTIPVVTIRRSRVPFADAIRRALQITDHAVIIWRESGRDAAQKACNRFGGAVSFCPVPEDRRELDMLLGNLKAQGVRVVIGAGTLNVYAEKHGLSIINVPYDEEDILTAVRIAEHNLHTMEEREEFAETLRGIQDNIAEGIVSLSPDGTIQTVNHAAAQLLQLDAHLLEGKSVSDTELNCQGTKELLERQEPFNSRIIYLRGCPVTMDGRPIFVRDHFKSAILTLTTVEHLQRSEESVRAQMATKGDRASVTFSDIVGESSALADAIRTARRYAAVDSSVLIYGESGTGKEMFVQSIHNASARKRAPFVVINCAALPESLIESELFGYEKGAFTGALSSGKRGLFERGHKGTVFLDEISEMPLHVQARFLRVLQEHVVTPVGGQRTIPVDIRVIAATNRDLREMVQKQKFREDLYYRISILTMRLPPLRERENDIALLTRHFVSATGKRLNINIQDVRQDAIDYLCTLPYPGNIRQLSNIVERAIVLCEGDILDLESVVRSVGSDIAAVQGQESKVNDSEGAIAVLRGDTIRRALLKHHGNRAKTAQELGISTSTLYRRMRELGIKPEK